MQTLGLSVDPNAGFNGRYDAAAAAPTEFHADGGMIGEQQHVGLSQGSPNGNPQMDMMRLDQAVKIDPASAKEVQLTIQQAVESGEITMEQLHTIFQLAKAALQDPALWPNVRAFAIKSGLVGPDDLPQQYDRGLINAVMLAAKSAESMQQPQQPGQPVQALSNGGLVQGPGTGTSDSVNAVNVTNGSPVKVSSGEYVIPADVVAAKGKDFFDGMIRKYHSPTGYQK